MNFLTSINYLVFLILLTTCSNNSQLDSSLDIINLSDILEKPEEVKLSQFIQSIEYIPLEVTDQSILFGPLIEITEEFIIARNSGPSAMGPILLFDRKTGKFIRGIGKSGKGPEEFQMGNLTIYNIYNKSLYAIGYNRDIKEYDTKGKFLGSFKLPITVDDKVPKGFGIPNINLDEYLSSDIFVSYVKNSIGWDKRRIVLFTKDSIIKVFPNYLFWEREDWTTFSSFGGSNFFRWNGNLNFKEVYNDTVFQITKSSLIPRFVLNTEGHRPTPELQGSGFRSSTELPERLAKYFMIGGLCENENYLFFRFGYGKSYYTCVFNKISKKASLCSQTDSKQSAFIDDINGFMPIWPQKITNHNEMIYRLDPEKIIKWILENPEKANTLGKNMDWIKNYSETSNPVVVIAKLKK
jgi:hypothetical protein